MNRYKRLKKQEVELRNQLKKCKNIIEIENIKTKIAHVSMEQFKLHKNWNKKGFCEND